MGTASENLGLEAGAVFLNQTGLAKRTVSFDWTAALTGPRTVLVPGEKLRFVSKTGTTIIRPVEGEAWPFNEPGEFETGMSGADRTAKPKQGTYKYTASHKDGPLEDMVSGQIEIDPPELIASDAEVAEMLAAGSKDPEKLMAQLFEEIRQTATAMATANGEKPDKFFPNGIVSITFKAGYGVFNVEFGIHGPEAVQAHVQRNGG